MSIIQAFFFTTKGNSRAALTYTFTSNTANASLNVTSIGGYTAGKSDITITVNAGVYLYSTAITTPGLTLSGGTTGDTVTLVNKGYIAGQGGSSNTKMCSACSNTAGGPALKLGFNTTIDNTNSSAYIGGGGGSGGSAVTCASAGFGGGGAGGGRGGGMTSPGASIGTAGNGGVPGSSGLNGATFNCTVNVIALKIGGGGGRIFPGTGGAASLCNGVGGGAGGGGAGGSTCFSGPLAGGAGGSGSAAGSHGCTVMSGGGGGWGASGGAVGPCFTSYYGVSPQTPKAGGKAVCLNGKTVTWVACNKTRVYGAIS